MIPDSQMIVQIDISSKISWFVNVLFLHVIIMRKLTVTQTVVQVIMPVIRENSSKNQKFLIWENKNI